MLHTHTIVIRKVCIKYLCDLQCVCHTTSAFQNKGQKSDLFFNCRLHNGCLCDRDCRILYFIGKAFKTRAFRDKTTWLLVICDERKHVLSLAKSTRLSYSANMIIVVQHLLVANVIHIQNMLEAQRMS